MKICFIVPALTNCGPVNLVFNLCKSLFYLKHDVSVISLRQINDEVLLKKFTSVCTLGVIFLKNNSKDIEGYLNDFDIIHSHGFYPDKLLSNLNTTAKKISTVHCMFYQDYVKEYGFLKGLIGSFLHFKYLKNGNFSVIVGCSKSVKQYIENRINILNVMYVNNGVDQNIFKPLSLKEKLERRKELEINGYKKIFIYSGRLIRRKRVPELIDIFKEQYNKDSLLIVLGDGEEMQDCKNKIVDDNVMFMGEVNNPSYYYQISDFVISNSSAEGYPMSIIEAVSCGCKALLSDIPPHNEFIVNNPNLAFLINDYPNLDVAEDNDIKKLSSEIMTMCYLDFYKR